ncbi:RNA polymerase sigma factor [Mycolicibacterium neworleansense]|uniref:Putative RNA polymerase sigma factor containing a TPR repeat domain protein n=1 Tax=Mycolicibacterium neworleansense TaxID=146018 RepID=A0A0H5S992_9MYCO|nr:RNA polymerase sigma factor [Mycolicibacterium neworleansense]MCV7365551.1 RNA polymerase sigma factor [Mycolicibacterium neworleansense]CRZ17909.1 putative RNA polymerase sigma factor containing a TPR repeat domain protein [Mycolicibacterium neworleansense]
MRATLDAVWRMEAAKILATLTRTVGDVALAEDLASDALLDALTQWPQSGVPRNPGAWLTTVAKRKAIDHWRRAENLDAKYAVLARDLAEHVEESWDPDRIDDDVLRLIFIAAHPVLSREAQVALTLRMIGGLSTDEIARAFLISTATAAARITRAKKSLTQANPPFEVPPRDEYPQRLSAVLSVIYLIYNEGYSASFGQRWIRDELCAEALRLGRVLAALVPDEPEVHGLLALMEFQSSRFAARTDAQGRPILLEDQNRARWDRAQIQRGVAALQRSSAARQQRGWGPYALQAALAECHAVAPTAADTDWSRIVALYDALLQITPSPVVQLNRAVAVAMHSGPREALAIVDGIEGLDGSYLLPSVRGELLSRLGRHREAAQEFTRAAALTDNEREREVLTGKATREHG